VWQPTNYRSVLEFVALLSSAAHFPSFWGEQLNWMLVKLTGSLPDPFRQEKKKLGIILKEPYHWLCKGSVHFVHHRSLSRRTRF